MNLSSLLSLLAAQKMQISLHCLHTCVNVAYRGTDKVPMPSKVITRRTSAARKKGESEGSVSSKGVTPLWAW